MSKHVPYRAYLKRLKSLREWRSTLLGVEQNKLLGFQLLSIEDPNLFAQQALELPSFPVGEKGGKKILEALKRQVKKALNKPIPTFSSSPSRARRTRLFDLREKGGPTPAPSAPPSVTPPAPPPAVVPEEGFVTLARNTPEWQQAVERISGNRNLVHKLLSGEGSKAIEESLEEFLKQYKPVGEQKRALLEALKSDIGTPRVETSSAARTAARTAAHVPATELGEQLVFADYLRALDAEGKAALRQRAVKNLVTVRESPLDPMMQALLEDPIGPAERSRRAELARRVEKYIASHEPPEVPTLNRRVERALAVRPRSQAVLLGEPLPVGTRIPEVPERGLAVRPVSSLPRGGRPLPTGSAARSPIGLLEAEAKPGLLSRLFKKLGSKFKVPPTIGGKVGLGLGVGGVGLDLLFLRDQLKKRGIARALEALPDPDPEDYLRELRQEELLARRASRLKTGDPGAYEALSQTVRGRRRPAPLPVGGFRVGLTSGPNGVDGGGLDDQELRSVLAALS